MPVPVRAIVGLVFYVAFTLLVSIIVYLDKLPEKRPILITVLCGLVFVLATAIYFVYKMATQKLPGYDPNKRIVFQTCPDYYTRTIDTVNKRDICVNYQYDDKGNEHLILPNASDYSQTQQNAMMQLDLSTLNDDPLLGNEERCKIAKSYAWTEAINACSQFAANPKVTLVGAKLKPLKSKLIIGA
jgi:hypothetical protein